jgi:phosphocarrier protein
MQQETNKAILTLEIKNELGLHARPATLFVQLAAGFESDINVEKDGELVNGKSLMGLLMLSAGRGSKINVSAEGPDCESAIKAIEELVNSKFQEEN